MSRGMFLEVSRSVLNGVLWTESKWKQQVWILFQTLFGLSTKLTASVRERRNEKENKIKKEEKRKEKRSLSAAVKHKNYDVSSSLHRRGFRDELSC